MFLYDSTLRVPWIIRAPGLVPKGRRVPGPVSTVDLAPTVLDLLGLPTLPAAQGSSLVPRIEGRLPDNEAVAFAVSYMPRIEFGWSELRMARDTRFKYVQAPREELYDLVDDPRELRNLASVEVDRARGMAAAIERWVETTTADRGTDADHPLSPAEVERLRSLGYLAQISEPLDGEYSGGLDPKDGMEYSIRVEEARAARLAGDNERAIVILEEVLRADPTNNAALGMLLKSLIEVKRFDDAERVALSAIETQERARNLPPTFLRQSRVRLAALYHLQGRESEAEVAFREALERWGADDRRAGVSLQGIRTAVAPDTALRVFDKLLETEPDHPVALTGKEEIDVARGVRER
jgi:tetratricopeptide (TPR) repeat protein